jgi:hypothetical protein
MRQAFSAMAAFDCVEMLGWADAAADGGAFLPALTGHLIDHFGNEQVELGRTGSSVRAEDGGVEAVLFGDELDAFALDRGVRLELERSAGRAGEADDVLAGEMVEQIARPRRR